MAATPPSTRRWTVADLDDLPDDGNRYELLDGALLVTPPPSFRHQHAQLMLMEAFRAASAYVLAAPVNAVVNEDTALQPDINVWPERFDLDGDNAPTPSVVIEISSPSTRSRDLGEKRDRYAADGIAEYWFADTERREIFVHLLVDGSYVGAVDDPATSTIFDVRVRAADVFG